MSMPIPGMDVRIPVPQPPQVSRPFGLFSQVVEGEGSPSTLESPGNWERGVWYWSTNCNLETGSLEGWCPVDDPSKPIDPFAPVKVEGVPFTIHSGQMCGLETFDAAGEASAQLERGEQYRAEQVFWEQQMARTDHVDLEDVPDEKCGLAVLEQYASQHYGGRPVLHVPVTLMPLLMSDYLVTEPGPGGQRLHTKWGTPVVVGAGYPQDHPARIMVTGQVHMWRGPVVANDHFDPRSNQKMAIAERTYVVTADCLSASVIVPGCVGFEVGE